MDRERERLAAVSLSWWLAGGCRTLIRFRLLNWPLPLDVDKDLAAAVVVGQLGLEEGREVLDHLDLGFLDVLHAAEHVLTGLFVFGLLGAELLLDPEVFLLHLLHLGERGVVCQAALFELLAGILRVVSTKIFEDLARETAVQTYLVLLHLGQGAVQALQPGRGGSLNIRLLYARQALVRSSKRCQQL